MIRQYQCQAVEKVKILVIEKLQVIVKVSLKVFFKCQVKVRAKFKVKVNLKVNVMKKYTSVSILHQSQDSDAGPSQDRESS